MTQGRQRYWGTMAPVMPASGVAAVAKQYEDLGLEGMFAGQVYGAPWPLLAAAATSTTRLTLASGVALSFARSPFETAMTAIDLDALSEGRFVLGLGPSVRMWNEKYFGVEYGKPVAHLREVVALVRHVIAGCHDGTLTPFEGSYHRFDPTGLQPLFPPIRREIPVWIAALRGPLVRLAAEIGQGVVGHPIWSISWATTTVQDEIAAGLRRAGRDRSDIHFNPWFWVAPSDDVATGVQDAKATVAFYGSLPDYEEYFAAHGFREEARRLQETARAGSYLDGVRHVPDEMARTFVVTGTPGQVADKLAPVWEYADSMCLVPPVGAPPERAMAYAATVAQTFYTG